MTGSGSALFALFGSKAERDLVEKVLEGDREFTDCRVLPARLVSGSGYRRLWRRQLAEHIADNDPSNDLWPLPSRHGR